jgi:MoaA/NifB/PqqE/SkfB family radical SAM enzyme
VAGIYRFSLECDVIEGDAGLGILSADRQSWLPSESTDMFAEMFTVSSRLRSGQQFWLMLYNDHPDGDRESQFLVKHIAVSVEFQDILSAVGRKIARAYTAAPNPNDGRARGHKRQPERLGARLLRRVREAEWRSFLAQLESARGIEYPLLLLGRTGHPRVTPDQLRRIEQELLAATLDEVVGLFPGDRMLSNFVLNLWEWGHGCTTLQSLPWNVSLPISDVCNARCTFCTSWLDGKKQLTLEQLEMFEPVLRSAVYVGLVGHGEPLSHPNLGEIAHRLGEYLDPRASSYTITNGVYLAKWLDRIDQLRLSTISCSLNAATPETHREVMGFPVEEFPRIVESLRTVAAGRASKNPIAVSITLVVIRQNLHEIPAFIELGNEIGATSIYLRTLLPQDHLVRGLNYHLLPAYLHPDFEALRADAIAAMKASAIPVYGEPDTWASPIFPATLARKIEAATPVFISRADAFRDEDAHTPGGLVYKMDFRKNVGAPNLQEFPDNLKDGSNPLNRHAPFKCRAVYNNLYVNELFLRMAPCCYLTNTPEHEEVRLMDVGTIAEAWNAQSMRTLRQRLSEGPLYGACERCPIAW